MLPRLRPRIPVVLLILIVAGASTALGQALEPIRYTVSFPAPQTHYLDVEAIVPTAGQPSVELMMAVWTPGSYLVREYSRNVEAVAARADGRDLAVTKTAKNRWRVTTTGAPHVTITYRVYSREMTVRNNWVDADFAMINGAPTFLTLPERDHRPHEVTLRLPAAWKTSISGLPDAPGGAPHHYLAPDYDTLVDSPIVAGNPAVHRFEVGGKPHVLVDVGEAGVWNAARAVADVQRIVAADLKLWRALPYDRYVFFNILTGGGGGLEHRNSVMMMASRQATSTRDTYVGWLSLVSHEYFHLWNVKRLRPVALGPFDYEHEVHTRSLWIAEGFTDYYADVMLTRAGLINEEEYERLLSDAIRSLQTTPGRLVQPVSLASYDAWIKYYRPDENSPNVTVSYYTKGAVLGFLLDARVRRATRGAKSLDDVMRLAFERYSGEHGYTPAEFTQTASDVAGEDLTAWFTAAADTTEELDYAAALDWYGLQFRSAPPAPREAPGWLGLKTRADSGRIIISEVRRGTPGYDAGLNVDDEILAIDDLRVTAEQLDTRLKAYRPGQNVSVLVARRDEMRRIAVTLGQEPPDLWPIDLVRNPTAAQHQHLAAWIGEWR